jgi:hypothetical protein
MSSVYGRIAAKKAKITPMAVNACRQGPRSISAGRKALPEIVWNRAEYLIDLR